MSFEPFLESNDDLDYDDGRGGNILMKMCVIDEDDDGGGEEGGAVDGERQRGTHVVFASSWSCTFDSGTKF